MGWVFIKGVARANAFVPTINAGLLKGQYIGTYYMPDPKEFWIFDLHKQDWRHFAKVVTDYFYTTGSWDRVIARFNIGRDLARGLISLAGDIE